MDCTAALLPLVELVSKDFMALVVIVVFCTALNVVVTRRRAA